MRVAIHYSGGKEYSKSLNKLLNILKEHEIITIYDFKKNDSYYYEVKHYNFYKRIFDICEEKNVDLLLLTLDELIDADILLNEMRKRKTEVIFRFTYREIKRTKVREKSFIDLFDLPNTKAAILVPMIDKGLDIKHPKIKVAFSNSLENKSKLKVLYFGRIKEAKGIDVLIDAINYLPDNIEVIIAGEPDPDYDVSKLKNLSADIGFINEEKMDNYFRMNDVIVLPYTKSYEYGHSSILLQACDYKKPVIVPNFFPFNEIIKEYKIGKTFKAEDPVSLAETIMSFDSNSYLDYLNKNDLYDLIRGLIFP